MKFLTVEGGWAGERKQGLEEGRWPGNLIVDFPGKASVGLISIHCETLAELEDPSMVVVKPILCLWHHMMGTSCHPTPPTILGFGDKGIGLTRSEHNVLAATYTFEQS